MIGEDVAMDKTTNKPKKIVIIYVRKSRLKNDDTMEISRQIDLLVKYCEANNLDYVILSEEGSSESWERPELQKMIKMLETNMYDGVLVTDQDRISRDSVDFGKFKRICKKEAVVLYTLNKVYNFLNDDDDFVTGIQAEIDNQFMRITKRKLMRGRIQALKEGVYFGIPPYGYKKDTKTKRLSPDENEAKAIRIIFDLMVNQGKNAVEIAEQINMLGYTTRENKKFNNRAIYYIISNAVYIGNLEYRLANREPIIVEDAHEAIISKEVFEKAQVVRQERRIVPQNITRGKYMLSKLIRCKECNTTLSFCRKHISQEAKRKSDKDKKVPYVLSCYASLSGVKKSQINKENRCKCVGIKASRIEELVYKELDEYVTVLDQEIEILLNDGNEFFKEMNIKIETLNNRLKQLDNEKIKVQKGWKKGIYDDDEAENEIKSIREERALVEQKLKEAEKIDISSEIKRKKEIKEKVLKILSGETKDIKETNELLRDVVDHIIYYKEVPDSHASNFYPDFDLVMVYKQ